MKQSCLPLSVSSNNTVAISVTGCTDSLRDGQAELASMEVSVTSTIIFFGRKSTDSIVLFICRVCPCKLCNLTCSTSLLLSDII